MKSPLSSAFYFDSIVHCTSGFRENPLPSRLKSPRGGHLGVTVIGPAYPRVIASAFKVKPEHNEMLMPQ